MGEGAPLPPAPVPEPALVLREQLDFWGKKVQQTEPRRGYAELGVRWDNALGASVYAGALYRFNKHWSAFGEGWASFKGIGAMAGLRLDW